jgi:thiamine-phosphate pyrophosphorylase
MTEMSRLYVVCDAAACARAGWSLFDFAAACLDGGARLLQLRAKDLPSRDLLALADRIVARAHASGAQVIVNDRADIATLSGADGVHVGQDDLAPADVRRVVGHEAIVGFSTHTPAQIDAALLEPLTYVAVGPVFGTTTKETGYAAVGLALVRHAAAVIERHTAAAAGRAPIPLVAIGGITLDRAPDAIAAGATSVAVISDLLATGDPASRVRAYLDRLACV